MARRTAASRQRRTPLSRERVVAAAIALADEAGIEALSMRRLADELGVEAMSLYNHVANKDDLLDAILEAVGDEIAVPAHDDDWKAAIHAVAASAHDALLRHPWASSLWMTRTNPGRARLRYADSLLAALRRGGFSDALIYHGYHIVQACVLGYTVQVLNYRAIGSSDIADVSATLLSGRYAEEYPDLVEHIRQHMQPREDGIDAFALGLDLILEGLERLPD
jgi:AcrR family transcriptional regulator